MSFILRTCTTCKTTSDFVQYNGLCHDCDPGLNPSVLTMEMVEQATRDAVEGKRHLKAEVKPAAPGKPSISLIPREAIFEMARSFDYGTGKHGRYAFRDGVEFSKLIDAALRHLHAIADGEDIDGDSGEAKLLHAGNAMSNLAMLLFCMKHKPEFDDRWKK